MSQRCLLLVIAAGGVIAAAPAAFAQEDTSWSGWYAGVNLGGNWGHEASRMTAAPGAGPIVIPPGDRTTIAAFSTSSNPPGFVGGVEGGFNYSHPGSNLVLGFETDFEAFNFDQHGSAAYTSALLVNPPITFTVDQKLTTDWLWTLRPRLGWAVGRWLFYSTAGMTLSDVKLRADYADTYTPPNVAKLATSSAKIGWTAGAGLAYALSSRWSIKAEYLYANLGGLHATATTPTNYAVLNSRGSAKSNIVRMGLDFRF